ncbi:GIY-YIG nuclease family protein [Mucilaginibacter xinganensis]|uniref:Nuclease n=1 Tax=Mucilaginibacter xinganensis TaxID=1234841 RepID=A0A223NXQ4_9SPHI|nr:hypothetical protein [Mucilaginibacter xinganensis]ASU34368.1 nuclease [Mucilaginibacter xinganensis]
MKRYFFVYANEERTLLHAGVTSDIVKTMKFYDGLITLLPKPKKLNYLVYLEDTVLEVIAQKKLIEFGGMKQVEKVKLVESVNPQFIEITAESLQHQGW